MRAVGPFFPPEIQRHVVHAEKLARILLRIEQDEPDCWSIGRASELAAFVEDVVSEWRRDRRAAPRVSTSLASYLEWLHIGMRARMRSAPSCCNDAVTVDARVAQ